MPQRWLKPGIRTSERYSRVSWAAQALYLRLVTLVDDYALYEANPRLLTAECFPFGDPAGRRLPEKRLQQMLDELAGSDLLCLYVVNGSSYLHLHRWTERVRTKNPSRFPPPPATICQHMTADDRTCCQPTTNAALPTSTTTTTSTTTVERENGAAHVLRSRTRIGALLSQVKDLERDMAASPCPETRDRLKKKRRELAELQEKQANGEF